jgi:nitroreductase
MPMDVFEAIKDRRTIREFSQAPIEFDKLTAIIEAGTYAPSSGNLQNWKFIIVTNKDIIKDLHNYCLDQVWISSAQALIIVCALPEPASEKYGLRGERLYTTQNIAACAQNMLLTAHALELGAAWIGAFDEDKISSIFEIPPNARPQAIIALGYPDYEPPEKIMQPLSSQVYFNSYGMTIKDLAGVLKEYYHEVQRAKKIAKQKSTEFTDVAGKFLKEKFKEVKENIKFLMDLK